MCIIIYKPKGIAMPSDLYLSNSWSQHSDGSGVYCDDLVKKGFMLEQDLKDYLNGIGSKNEVVIHFRTSTSGGDTKQMTHPFPISDKLKEIHLLEYFVDKPIIFHNGVLSINNIKNMSDTATLALELGNLKLSEKQLESVFRLALGSDKGVLIFPNGKVKLFGDFYKDTDGCYYSNKSYLTKWTGYNYQNYYGRGKSYIYTGKSTLDGSTEVLPVQTELDEVACKYLLPDQSYCSYFHDYISIEDCNECFDLKKDCSDNDKDITCELCGEVSSDLVIDVHSNFLACPSCVKDFELEVS